MRQSDSIILLLLVAAGVGVGCKRRPAAPAIRPGGIVSLTPAGTDLLVAMGLGDRIVGVSPYEANEELRRRLPKVGDYERIDWERLTELKPAFLVVQGKKDRLPPGVRERCFEMNITTVILQIDRLADIASAVGQIGQAVGDPGAAGRAVDTINRRQHALQENRPQTPVPTLLLFGDGTANAVGRETYIDDVLTLAGGANVLDGHGYLSLDTERLASLRPTVVFLLIPGGTPTITERAVAAVLAANLPGVTRQSIVPVTAADTLMPGTAALTLAETMAARFKAAP